MERVESVDPASSKVVRVNGVVLIAHFLNDRWVIRPPGEGPRPLRDGEWVEVMPFDRPTGGQAEL